MKEIKLAILGFGNAAQAFSRLLLSKEKEIEDIYGTAVKVVAITTRSRGALENSSGIDLTAALLELSEEGKFDQEGKSYSEISSMGVVETVDYDVLVELTPLQIFSGQPAIDHIKKALGRGKHVVTANKGPVAWAYKELHTLALEKKCQFYFETAVMDGTPVFNLVNDTLKLCKVLEVDGILNTTTNFVLEELAKGGEYDGVMAEGRRRGFVEADPAMDMEGWDAAAKTTALLNVLMDADISPLDIDRRGIENITAMDMKAADDKGCVVKLICHGEIRDGKVIGTVQPVEVPRGTLPAIINGTSSLVSITTDLMGKISVVEHDPGIEQTAYGIFSDLIRVIEY